jgi:hypothetical protein
MNRLLVPLRKASTLIISVCIVATPAALLPFIASFVQPRMDIQRLYRLSDIGWAVGIGSILASLLIVVGLSLTFSRILRAQKQLRLASDRRRHWRNVGGVILGVLLLTCFFPEFRSVHFSAGTWISAGWGQIAESTARQYLWGAIRLSSVFVLVSGFNTGLFLIGARDAAKAVEGEQTRGKGQAQGRTLV